MFKLGFEKVSYVSPARYLQAIKNTPGGPLKANFNLAAADLKLTSTRGQAYRKAKNLATREAALAALQKEAR